ncbi:MAG: PAS domain-containing protein [Oligoflexia bacterium]|nr:PAS domain-containing protein [Oligoflexia bacterium]
MAHPRPDPINVERPFGMDELFFSTTDRKGIIQFGNSVFSRLSGYSLQELIGEPHNVIRHPDMPRAVFQLLWDYLLKDKTIVAYVKNLARDGAYYWVMALVLPVRSGFLSIRFKPSSPVFKTVQDVYKSLLSREQKLAASVMSRKDVIRQTQEELGATLASIGFPNYDAFMHMALREELRSRQSLCPQSFETASATSTAGGTVAEELLKRRDRSKLTMKTFERYFSSLDEFLELNKQMNQQFEFIGGVARSMRFLAINASIQSALAKDNGAALDLVAQGIGQRAGRITKEGEALGAAMHSLVSEVNAIIFDIAAAKLESEMSYNFLNEMIVNNLNDVQVTEALEIMEGHVRDTISRLIQALSKTHEALAQIGSSGAHLRQVVQTLEFIHLNGKIEVARSAHQIQSFQTILHSMHENVQNTFAQIASMASNISGVSTTVTALTKSSRELSQTLAGL